MFYDFQRVAGAGGGLFGFFLTPSEVFGADFNVGLITGDQLSPHRKNVILDLCKGLHCVDLDESFQTHIYLQNLASMQPRTSPSKLDS